jgi:nitrite reductase (NADH) small subunit
VDDAPRWLDVGDVAEVVKRKKFVVGEGDDAKVVIVRDNCVYALDNVCIHKQRELVKGVILGDRIVCPGHQWAYQLESGWEAKMERCQPTYDIRVNDGRVEVDVDTRRVVTGPPEAAAEEAPAEATPG